MSEYVNLRGQTLTLDCVVCEKPFTYVKGAGRLRRFCSDRCATQRKLCQARAKPRKKSGARPAIHDRECAACGQPFKTANKQTKTCSFECSREIIRAKAVALGAEIRKATSEKRTVVCEECGERFVGRNLSGRARAGARVENRFCSRECTATAKRVYSSKQEAKRAENSRIRGRRLAQKTCADCGISLAGIPGVRVCSACVEARARSRGPGADRSPRPCQECGKAFVPTITGRIQIYCGKACRKKINRRICKGSKRAREKKLRAGRVDPIKVFERDGWRCHICKRKTPRKLRGTIEPRAPELDHILPLSKGGDHTYANTACACRECNGAKSDTPFGQLGLFCEPVAA